MPQASQAPPDGAQTAAPRKGPIQLPPLPLILLPRPPGGGDPTLSELTSFTQVLAKDAKQGLAKSITDQAAMKAVPEADETQEIAFDIVLTSLTSGTLSREAPTFLSGLDPGLLSRLLAGRLLAMPAVGGSLTSSLSSNIPHWSSDPYNITTLSSHLTHQSSRPYFLALSRGAALPLVRGESVGPASKILSSYLPSTEGIGECVPESLSSPYFFRPKQQQQNLTPPPSLHGPRVLSVKGALKSAVEAALDDEWYKGWARESIKGRMREVAREYGQ